jgi:hypothetical protein
MGTPSASIVYLFGERREARRVVFRHETMLSPPPPSPPAPPEVETAIMPSFLHKALCVLAVDRQALGLNTAPVSPFPVLHQTSAPPSAAYSSGSPRRAFDIPRPVRILNAEDTRAVVLPCKKEVVKAVRRRQREDTSGTWCEANAVDTTFLQSWNSSGHPSLTVEGDVDDYLAKSAMSCQITVGVEPCGG